jgi:hypothetical protein
MLVGAGDRQAFVLRPLTDRRRPKLQDNGALSESLPNVIRVCRFLDHLTMQELKNTPIFKCEGLAVSRVLTTV